MSQSSKKRSITNPLGGWLDSVFGRSKTVEAYLDNQYYQHRNFDVKGLTTQGLYTLELEQVFVELKLGKPSKRASSDPIRTASLNLQKGQHDIWSFLRSEKLGAYNFVVLGAPGSGKTTLLKHLTISLVAEHRTRNGGKALNWLPLMLFLRDHIRRIRQNPNYSLADAAADAMVELDPEDEPVPLSWLQKAVADGRFLIMLDGLDEVANPQLRRLVVQWVDKQMRRFSGNRFIITSRPFGYYSNPIPDSVVLEVQPFTMPQVRQFIDNWYLANEIKSSNADDKGVRLVAREGATDLFTRLQQMPVLLDLAVNPLLLTMIATVHRYRSSLPGRRVELYAEICEVFLGKRYEARGIEFELTPAQKQRVLQPLAYFMMRKKVRELKVEDAATVINKFLKRVSAQSMDPIAFLVHVADTSGLLIEREAGVYSFAHLTFQEYLTSQHIAEENMERVMLESVNDIWWHETIRLFAARVDATKIVKRCINQTDPPISTLTLAMECLEEAREVDAGMRKIFDRLMNSVEHEDAGLRRIAANVMLTMRVRRMARISDKTYIADGFISHAEYQLFLGDYVSNEAGYTPFHWTGFRFPSGMGQTAVLGVQPGDAYRFCNWLTEREGGRWRYRLPTAEEVQMGMSAFEPTTSAGAMPASCWFRSGKAIICKPVDISRFKNINQIENAMKNRLDDDFNFLHTDLKLSRADVNRLQIKLPPLWRKRGYMMLNLYRELPADFPPEMMQLLRIIRDRQTPFLVNELLQELRKLVGFIENGTVSELRDVILDSVIELAEMIQTAVFDQYRQDELRLSARKVLRQLQSTVAFLNDDDDFFNFAKLIQNLNTTRSHVQQLAFNLNNLQTRARRRLRLDVLKECVSFQIRNDPENRQRQAQELLAAYFDLYLDFAILEGRIAQRLPPIEGICIVKEQI